MRHAKPYRKLSRQRSHYQALMRNLAISLFDHERIRTTLIKAKEVRRLVDKIITLGKKGEAHNRRRAFSLLGNPMLHVGTKNRVDITAKIFGELAKRFKDRNGGYTRIIKLSPRPGDAAPMAIMELLGAQLKSAKKDDDSKVASADGTPSKKPASKSAKSKTKTKKAEEQAA